MFADAVRAPEGTASRADSATAADGHIAALDGLRFLAALFVAAAHYSAWVLIDSNLTSWLAGRDHHVDVWPRYDIVFHAQWIRHTL